MNFTKVAIVANSCWNIYKFRLNLIDKLCGHDHEVYVIAPLDEFISYKEQFPSVKHIALQNLSRDSTNPITEIKLLLELSSIYKKYKFDIVIHFTHKPNIFGGFAATLQAIPSIAVVTGLGYAFIHKGIINRITRYLYGISNRYHQKVIFENEDDLKLFIDLKILNGSKGISIKGCGVDVEYYKPKENSKRKDKLVFTFIGRLLYDKGIKEFVEATKLLKEETDNFECWVVGELDAGNPSMISRKELLSWIEDDLINYLGFVDDIRDIISQSDCIVLPSYREGMPRVILEAMSMKKMVIASNVAGCREAVVNGENGFLVDCQSVNSLSEAILKTCKLHDEKRYEMGEKGRSKAILEFNSEKISQELYEIISQAYFCSK